MSYIGQIIDLFVSSPGDVSAHRNTILTIVQAWNQRNGRSKKLFFNCLRWEDLVAADIGKSGQDVINDQIGDDYDIFLGVMWARFGSPTLNAESGTEEEFARAVDRHQAGEPIKVSFLFCTTDVPMAQLDGDQYKKVQDFKHRVQAQGCLTRDFVDDASLTNAINLILDRFSNTWEVNLEKSAIPINNYSKIEHFEENNNPKTEDQDNREDFGILDALDNLAEHNSEFISSINDWTSRLGVVSEETSVTTGKLSDLAKFGRPSSQQIRDILSNLSKVMENFASWCEDEIAILEKSMENLSQDSLMIIDLSRDFEEPTEDIINARNTLEQVHEGIEETIKSTTDFADSLEESPKMDKKLNRANRRVVSTHRRLAEKYRLFQQDVALCIEDLNARLGDR